MQAPLSWSLFLQKKRCHKDKHTDTLGSSDFSTKSRGWVWAPAELTPAVISDKVAVIQCQPGNQVMTATFAH